MPKQKKDKEATLKKKKNDTSNAVKLTPDQIKAYREEKWEDIDAELEAAYEEENINNPDEKDLQDCEETFRQQAPEYQNYVSARGKEYNYPAPTKQEMKNIKIEEIHIGLPSSLDELNKQALNKPMKYMPKEIKPFVSFHRFIIEVLSGYAPKKMVQPDENVFEPLKMVIQFANSYGLAFRKMFTIKGTYCVIFFTFTDKRLETQIEDYRRDGHMMLQDESIVIEKKLQEMEKLEDAEKESNPDNNAETDDKTNEPFDDSITLAENLSKNGIRVREKEILLSYQQTTDYIYSELSVLIFAQLHKPSLPEIIKENDALIIRWEKHPDILCKFHALLILPND